MLKPPCLPRVSKLVYVLSAVGLASMIVACAGPEPDSSAAPDSAEPTAEYQTTEWAESGGIRVPAGFEAQVFAESVGRGRHIVVRDNGDVFVRLREPRDGGGVAALRDEDGDGVADRIETFGPDGGTGIAIHGGELFFSGRTEVFKVALPNGDGLVPTAEVQSVVAGFPEQRSHTAKALAFDEEGNLYVNSGAPSNACQAESRTAGSPGLEPCPELERGGAIWRYPADGVGLEQTDGELFATGIRNAVGLGYSPALERVVAGSHGRDQLDTLWPDHFTAEQNAELPAEELLALEQGADYGWPYAYWDGDNAKARIVVARVRWRRHKLRPRPGASPHRPWRCRLTGHRMPSSSTMAPRCRSTYKRRCVRRVPRFLESGAATAGWLQHRVRPGGRTVR